MAIIKVPQLNKTIQVDSGANLMESLLSEKIPVASSCKGDGICGKCRLEISGSPDALNSPTELEIKLFEKETPQEPVRLSCQGIVLGDIEVKSTYW